MRRVWEMSMQQENVVAQQRHGRTMLIAGMAVALAIGIAIGALSPLRQWFGAGTDADAAAPDAWRSALVELAKHHTSETLVALPQDETANRARLAALAKLLEIDLAPERVDASGRRPRFVDYLFHANQRYGEIVYFDEENGASSLFIARRDGADAAPVSEIRDDMTAIYWSTPKHVFMLTGPGAEQTLRPLADALHKQLSP